MVGSLANKGEATLAGYFEQERFLALLARTWRIDSLDGMLGSGGKDAAYQSSQGSLGK
jgi:hypothetical protein